MATQAHPELKSRPTRPHPLFTAFVAAAVAYAAAGELPVGQDQPVAASSEDSREAVGRRSGSSR